MTELPPLPEPAWHERYCYVMQSQMTTDDRGFALVPLYTADQMRSYAAAAVAAEREGQSRDAARYRWLRVVGGPVDTSLVMEELDDSIDAAMASADPVILP